MTPEQKLVHDWREQLVQSLGLNTPTAISWRLVHQVLDQMEEFELGK